MTRLLTARRSFLGLLAGLPWVGGLTPLKRAAAAGTPPARDVIKELGVRSFINAAGTFTAMTGSLMAPEVMAAMQAASRKFVKLEDLHNAAGKRIAELLHCEAALVTAGCASALSLATAACVAGSDRERILRLPDTTGMKDMLNVMSKFLALGLPVEDVILRSTWNPARAIRQEQLGHLSVGAPGDVAVLRLETGEFGFIDSYGARLRGTRKLTCELTLRDGKIVYDLNGLARPEWTTLPKDYRATGDPRWDGIRISSGRPPEQPPPPPDKK